MLETNFGITVTIPHPPVIDWDTPQLFINTDSKEGHIYLYHPLRLVKNKPKDEETVLCTVIGSTESSSTQPPIGLVVELEKYKLTYYVGELEVKFKSNDDPIPNVNPDNPDDVRSWLNKVVEVMKEDGPFKDMPSSKVISHVDTFDALEKFEEGLTPREYVEEFILSD